MNCLCLGVSLISVGIEFHTLVLLDMLGFGFGWFCWDEVVSLLGVSGWVIVDLGYGCVGVVVFRSVGLCCLVYVLVCF